MAEKPAHGFEWVDEDKPNKGVVYKDLYSPEPEPEEKPAKAKKKDDDDG